MKRTTIFIPEALEDDLQRHARRAKKPVAWVVREAVTAYLAAHQAPSPVPSSVGMGRSGRSDLSERFEDLLFADESPAGDRASLPARRTRTPPRRTRATPRRRTRKP